MRTELRNSVWLGRATMCCWSWVVTLACPTSEFSKWAVTEERIIITTDTDFEELIWRQRLPRCGVLRLENLPRAPRIELLDYVLANHGDEFEYVNGKPKNP